MGFSPALAAADLDGTLIGRDLSWAEGTPEALAELQAAGVHTVVCTGRMLQSVRRVAARLGITAGPVICYQGALVADLRGGDWWRHVRMDGPIAAEVVRHVAAMGRQLNAYIDDELYVEEVTEWARRYAEHVEVGIGTVADLEDEVVRRPPTKLVLVTSAEVSKSGALAWLCERLGVARERVLTLGDGMNDVDMLEWAGLGVAVEEAAGPVRAAADLVVPRAGVPALLRDLAARAREQEVRSRTK